MLHTLNDSPVNKFERGLTAIHTVPDSPTGWTQFKLKLWTDSHQTWNTCFPKLTLKENCFANSKYNLKQYTRPELTYVRGR